MKEKVLVLDFGSQFSQSIVRRVRSLSIYCEIFPYDSKKYNFSDYKAIILSGSPFSVNSEDIVKVDISEVIGKQPILGICYGAQYLSHFFGGEVAQSDSREYGRSVLSYLDEENSLFYNIKSGTQVWMSHSDTIVRLPRAATCIASTSDVKNAGYCIKDDGIYAVQFHPEVYHTIDGLQLFENFLIRIAGISRDWIPKNFVESSIEEIKAKVKNDKVILGISGGVDSTVSAVLLDRAIGKNLYCIFINNGFLRKNEFEEVLRKYEKMGLNVKGVDASEGFLEVLKGVFDPEEKRKFIGKAFIDVFDEEARLIKDVVWLGQGTLYPDVIESVSPKGGPSANIKSHHNVGGLPDFMKLKIVEPLRMIFKDEVRKIGESMGIDSALLHRHPFPGPGLAIRILGEVTFEKLEILREADHIFIEGLKKHLLYDSVWQAGVILLSDRSVGVMGDDRTYERAVVLRAVESVDGMTADWVNLPHKFLQEISNEIINKVKGINRVVYDISSKPPATIEWE